MFSGEAARETYEEMMSKEGRKEMLRNHLVEFLVPHASHMLATGVNALFTGNKNQTPGQGGLSAKARAAAGGVLRGAAAGGRAGALAAAQLAGKSVAGAAGLGNASDEFQTLQSAAKRINPSDIASAAKAAASAKVASLGGFAGDDPTGDDPTMGPAAAWARGHYLANQAGSSVRDQAASLIHPAMQFGGQPDVPAGLPSSISSTAASAQRQAQLARKAPAPPEQQEAALTPQRQAAPTPQRPTVQASGGLDEDDEE
jgi:hypothetical protein